jgi:hypothetical protein
MLTRYRAILISALAATTWTASTLRDAGQAQTTQFICTRINGVYITLAKRTNGNDRPVIRWVSNDFEQKGYTTEKRCQEVSNRFQTYHVSGDLNYLTTGKMNGQPVICTTSQRYGTCDKLLFTVRPGVNPQHTLRQLLAVRVKSTVGALNESTAGPAVEEQIYVDMKEVLNGPEGESLPASSPNLSTVPVLPPDLAQPTVTPLVPNQPNSLW